MEIELKIKKEERSKIIIKENINFKNELSFLDFDRAAVITDKNIKKVLKNRINFAPVMEIKSDREKDIDDFKNIIDFLSENKLTRASVVIAAGGGKITDTAGFAASVYLRGIRWVSVPTTLLSQIDASVGGKTAVDFKAKNIIGSFHNPSAVLIDPMISVSRKENINEATGELIKYALISDKKTSTGIKKLLPLIKDSNYNAIKKLIEISVVYKSKIVSKDPFDEKGIRERLNFGHTAGHAIEHIYRIPHGNAITAGINFAFKLSRNLNILNNNNYHKLYQILKYDNFKFKIKRNDFNLFLSLISRDKKNTGYSNYFILINDKMELKKIKNTDKSEIKKTWEELCNEYS